MCSFEDNSALLDEKERAKGPKSAFPQHSSPKSDRLLGANVKLATFIIGRCHIKCANKIINEFVISIEICISVGGLSQQFSCAPGAQDAGTDFNERTSAVLAHHVLQELQMLAHTVRHTTCGGWIAIIHLDGQQRECLARRLT